MDSALPKGFAETTVLALINSLGRSLEEQRKIKEVIEARIRRDAALMHAIFLSGDQRDSCDAVLLRLRLNEFDRQLWACEQGGDFRLVVGLPEAATLEGTLRRFECRPDLGGYGYVLGNGHLEYFVPQYCSTVVALGAAGEGLRGDDTRGESLITAEFVEQALL